MTSSLSQTSENAIILDVKNSLAGGARRATYAIGGSILVKERSLTGDSVQVQPIHIWFGENGKGRKLTLPLPAGQKTSPELEALFSACAPVEFASDDESQDGDEIHEGEGGDEIESEEIDEPPSTKALELSSSAFATSFCPYQAGIVELVQQALLPYKLIEEGGRGICASLRDVLV